MLQVVITLSLTAAGCCMIEMPSKSSGHVSRRSLQDCMMLPTDSAGGGLRQLLQVQLLLAVGFVVCLHAVALRLLHPPAADGLPPQASSTIEGPSALAANTCLCLLISLHVLLVRRQHQLLNFFSPRLHGLLAHVDSNIIGFT